MNEQVKGKIKELESEVDELLMKINQLDVNGPEYPQKKEVILGDLVKAQVELFFCKKMGELGEIPNQLLEKFPIGDLLTKENLSGLLEKGKDIFRSLRENLEIKISATDDSDIVDQDIDEFYCAIKLLLLKKHNKTALNLLVSEMRERDILIDSPDSPELFMALNIISYLISIKKEEAARLVLYFVLKCELE